RNDRVLTGFHDFFLQDGDLRLGLDHLRILVAVLGFERNQLGLQRRQRRIGRVRLWRLRQSCARRVGLVVGAQRGPFELQLERFYRLDVVRKVLRQTPAIFLFQDFDLALAFGEFAPGLIQFTRKQSDGLRIVALKFLAVLINHYISQ